MVLFNIPNLLTALNFICGIFSIILSLVGKIEYATLPIIGSLVFDYLDGMAARMLNQKGELGKQLDSLADVVSFGLAPGIWMFTLLPYLLLSHPETFVGNEAYVFFLMWFESIFHGETHNYWPFIALIIPVFSMLRLAKFNIDERQTTSFVGLPTPANTLFFAIFPILLFNVAPNSLTLIFQHFFLHPITIISCIFIFSYLLIAELPLFSLKFKNLSLKENKVRFSFLILTLLAIISLKLLAIPIIIVLYLVISIIGNKFVEK